MTILTEIAAQLPDNNAEQITPAILRGVLTDMVTDYGSVAAVDAASAAAAVTATSLGLGNVNNTSDANKPVSTAQATAIAGCVQVSVQVLTAAQQAQARANVYAAPFDALADNGMQINGGVDVSQELGTTGATLATGTAKYIADCIQAQYVNAAGVVTSAQLAAASFPAALSGYSFGHQIKATTAVSSLANGDYALHRWIVEGYRIARLGFGAAGAQSFSYCLQFYSTVSGTAFLKFSNSNYSRCYYQEQTIAAGWNFLTGTIPGDTTGTWQTTNSVGLYVEIFAAGKAASPVAPGAWGATNTTQTTNSTNLLGTNANQTIATGLCLLPGTEVPSSARAPFLMRPFDRELQLCLRYYAKSFAYATAPAQGVGNATGEFAWPSIVAGAVSGRAPTVPFNVRMRAAPTGIIYNPNAANAQVRDENALADCSGSNVANATETLLRFNYTGNAATAVGNIIGAHWTADARL